MIDAVEHFGNELAKIEPRRDAGAPAEASGDAARQVDEILVVDGCVDPGRISCLLGKQIADAAADCSERVNIKARQADLDRARVVKAGVGGKVGMEPLCEWRKTLHALGPLKKGSGTGHDEV